MCYIKRDLTPKRSQRKEIYRLPQFIPIYRTYTEGKDVELEKLVEKAVVDKVRVAFNELKREIAIKPIFEKLNEAVSYGEIRMSLTLILRNE